jgi:CBS domain-containing protein/osmotically-inducible protein OsmY
MTSDPRCCVPYDSIATAVHVMKTEDVGPVPVVSDHNSRYLVGIITDRDIAIKAVGEGRDPHNTRVDEIMSLDPVTCREDDDTYVALQRMADYQVRRMPIVDAGERLVGIVSQADLARTEDEEDIGEMVEDISQPYGTGLWGSFSSGRLRTGSRGASSASSIAGSLALGAFCLGVGAGLMYLYDPNRGRTRRAVARSKASGWYSASGQALSRTTEDIKNRATGMVANTKSWLSSEPVDDDKLVARVRSRIGHAVSYPHAIEVEAHGGTVRLRGAILPHEARKLVKCVQRIPGVQSVEDQLELQTV